MSRPNFKQQGFSLIELLIAMVLGLFLTTGALEMMLASRNLERTTDDISRIQENGRFAIEFLARDIRMAGHGVTDNGAVNKPFFNGNCANDPDFSPCTADGGTAFSDRIAIMSDPSTDQDCTGTNVRTDEQIANVYFLAPDENNNNVISLFCRGYSIDDDDWTSAGQPLVGGIENMQILYGLPVLPISSNKEITRYIGADSIHGDPDSSKLWPVVSTVRLSLLVNNGLENGNNDTATRKFVLLDAPEQTFTDKHSREVYRTSTAAYNVLYYTAGTD